MAFDVEIGGSPAVKFEKVGDEGTIRLTDVKDVQVTDLDGKPKVYDDGNPMMQWVFTGVDVSDGEERRIFAKGQMKQAIRDAVKKAGAAAFEPNATLRVRHNATKASEKRGFNDQKLYEA